MKPALFVLIATVAFAQAPVTHAYGGSYVGVMVQEIDSERAHALKLPEEAGVEITRVEPDSPAEKAGLKPGDVIFHYNGQRVEGMEQFSRLVRETPAGRDVKLDIFRNGSPQSIPVKTGARRGSGPMTMMPLPPSMPPSAPMAMPSFSFRTPDIPRSFMTWRISSLGIDCEGLEGQLADYFGVKEGVLVRSVSKGSAAEKAGLRAGDVITRIEDARVSSPADVSGKLRSAARGKPMSLKIVRDHKEVTLSVSIAEDDHGQWWQPIATPVAMRAGE